MHGGGRAFSVTLAMEGSINGLLAELRVRQCRLGTAAELPEDYERVCDLAHAINNRITISRVAEELGVDERQFLLSTEDSSP